MWRPSSTRPAEVPAYQYNTQYNLQPTEDHEEAREAAERKGYSTAILKRPDYKPTALRWYFIACQIFLLSAMMAIVAYARIQMPHSDKTATIQERSLVQDWDAEFESHPGAFRRQEEWAPAGPTPVLAARASDPAVTSFSRPSPFTADILTVLSPSYIQSLMDDTSVLVSQAEAEEDGIEIDVTIPRVPCGTSTVCVTTITKQIITTLIIPATTQFFTITTSTTTIFHIIEEVETVSQSDVIFTTDIVTGVEDVSVVVETVVLTLPGTPRPPPSGNYTRPSTDATQPPQLTTQTRTYTKTFTQTITTPSVGTSAGTVGVITKTRTETEEIPIEGVGSVIGGDQTYFQLGETTIEVTYTPMAGEKGAGVVEPPVTHHITTIDPGRTVTEVVRDQPFQVVINDDNKLKTVVVGAQVDQVVQQVGGDVTNMVVVVTPSPVGSNGQSGSGRQGRPGQQGNPGVGSTQDFGDADLEGSDSDSGSGSGSGQGSSGQGGSRPGQGGPNSGQSGSSPGQGRPGQVGASGSGQQGSEQFDSDGGFEPITLTVVSDVGGELKVFTTQDAPQTIITTNPDGSPRTIITTPPPRVMTSRVGGSLTTFELVTTPTAGDLLSFTVVSTIDGSLTTMLTTREPTTYVTTISGTPKTITSTPSARTVTSTMKATTKTIISVTTATPTGEPEQKETKVFKVDAAKYFVGKFLPALLAIILSIPLRIIDLNAKLYQPFYALNRDNGALGPDSMTLHYNGFKGFIKPFVMLSQGHPMTFLTSIILWGSSLMVPLATEAIGLKLHGKCTINSVEGCGAELGVSPGPTHALLALLALIVTFLLLLIILTRNWESGLFSNPWNIAGIASLARCRDVRIHSARKKSIRKETQERRYGFGFFRNDQGRDEYGLVLRDASGQHLRQDRDSPAIGHHADSDDDDFVYDVNSGPARRRSTSLSAENQRTSVPFLALTYPWRIAFALFLTALFVVILYYHIQVMKGWNPEFRSFMNSGKFGARFLFAGFGVVITFAWISFFVSVAIITPYQLMAESPQPPERCILLSRPSHGIYGMFAAIKEANIFLFLTSFIAVLVEFLPLLLANIPFNLSQTLLTHVVCTRLSLSILAVMIGTLVTSMFIKWPKMPVDPRSLAGAIYYVSASDVLLSRVEGVAKMDGEARDRTVREYGGRYYYGIVAGKGRVGVEADEGAGVGDDVETAYHGHRL